MHLLIWMVALVTTSSVGVNGLIEIKLGIVMLNDSVLPFKIEMVGPALDMALQIAQTQFGVTFVQYVRLYPDWCNADLTTGYISDLYHNNHIQAIIGPGCSGDITVCGKLATYYNLPHVSGVGDLVLGKENYPTFTRLSYSLEKQSGNNCFPFMQFDDMVGPMTWCNPPFWNLHMGVVGYTRVIRTNWEIVGNNRTCRR